MTGEVRVTNVVATPTAVVVAKTSWAEFPNMWRPMLDEVWKFLRTDAPPGLYDRGHNVMLYRDDLPTVEVGVQVIGSFDPVGDVVASDLPAGLVATAIHGGPITAIGETHAAVCQRATSSGYELAGPRWEIYGDPDRLPAPSALKCSGRSWTARADQPADHAARALRGPAAQVENAPPHRRARSLSGSSDCRRG